MEDIWAWLHVGSFAEDVPACCEFQAAVINRPHVLQVQFFTVEPERARPLDDFYHSARDHHLGLIKFFPDWVVLTVDSERLEGSWQRVRRTFYMIQTLDRLLEILNDTDWGDTDKSESENDDTRVEIDRMVWGDALE